MTSSPPNPEAVVDEILQGHYRRAAVEWIDYLHRRRRARPSRETEADEDDWIIDVFFSERLRSNGRCWANFLIACIQDAREEMDLRVLAAGAAEDLLDSNDPTGISVFRAASISDPAVALVLRSAEARMWDPPPLRPDASQS